MIRNVGRQTLNLHFPHDLLQNSTLSLYAFGDSGQFHWHAYAKRLVHRDALQIDVQQRALDGLILPVDNHRFGLLAADFQIEYGVVTAVGVENAADLLGIYGNRD